MIRTTTLGLFCIFVMVNCAAQRTAQEDRPIAFPGAEGFGKYTTGGRGGKVFIVSTLGDNGPGSLRAAIDATGKRVIVFAISGTIALESDLRIRNGDITIAGQSAPGDGICVRNYKLLIDADNVIIRYLRFRLGDERSQQDDAVTGLRQRDIIIDHCSMSWATDECASFYDNENFTLQWCIISESLNHSVHEKGDHGYGGIWGGKGASFHHNIIAHHSSRLPRFCGARYHKQSEKEIVDFRNNIIYNWRNNNSYGGEKGNHNMVNNYYKPGPATIGSKANRIVNPFQPYGKFYLAGNVVEGHPEISENNNKGVYCDHPDSTIATQPFAVVALKNQSAKDAYQVVLKSAGASLHRDAVDTRVIEEVKSGKAKFGSKNDGIVDSQKDVGGWPELKSTQAPLDSDRDGMPDSWEKKMKLNPSDLSDAAGYKLHKQFTNLEMYLNSLLAQ